MDVLRLSGAYAFFLKSGAIFAPSVEQSVSIGEPDPGRSGVNLTTIDFYYVPRLPIPGAYVTVDPRSFTTGKRTNCQARFRLLTASRWTLEFQATKAFSSNRELGSAIIGPRITGWRSASRSLGSELAAVARKKACAFPTGRYRVRLR